MKKLLIVNADDFGLSEGVNRGIIEAHEHGIVTSASLMVRQSAARESAEYARRNPRLGVGLHLDLGEWIFRDGAWVPLYEVVPLKDSAAVVRELADQLQAFERFTGRAPTHLDSHQHVHMREPVRTAALAAARRLGVPLRQCTPGIRYCGEFYGQDEKGDPLPELIAVERLLAIFSTLAPGVTELACHPGFADELDTMYRSERRLEVHTLCDPRVRNGLSASGVEQRSFANCAYDVTAGAGTLQS